MPGELILKPGQQIIAIGDSITQAGGLLEGRRAVLAARYPELKLPPIRNEGSAGQKAEDLVKRFQKDVVDRKPAVVLISVGINDVWHRAGPASPTAGAGGLLGQRRQDGRHGPRRRNQGDFAHAHGHRRETRREPPTSGCGSMSRPRSRSPANGNARWSTCTGCS